MAMIEAIFKCKETKKSNGPGQTLVFEIDIANISDEERQLLRVGSYLFIERAVQWVVIRQIKEGIIRVMPLGAKKALGVDAGDKVICRKKFFKNQWYMYTFIGVAFTLKGQSFDTILPLLEKIKEALAANNEKAALVHGFLPKHVVIEKGFSTDVVNSLEEKFPVQVNFCPAGKVDRAGMAEFMKEMGGTVYVIGEEKEGVAEEVRLYEENGIKIKKIPLDWAGELTELI